jgi:hypothetical protein
MLIAVGVSLAAAQPAKAYSRCNVTSMGVTAVLGRCGTARIYLAGSDSMFGRIGSSRVAITYLSSSMFGRLGPNRFFYSVTGSSVFGRYGGLRVFASVLSGGTVVGRVDGLRSSCISSGNWYFCRGNYAEAMLPIAALLLNA